MKLTYHWEGDYLIPDLTAPESPKIGIWGERRRQFLRKHQRPIYDAMLMNGTLNAHLEEINLSAEEIMNQLMIQIAKEEEIDSVLKTQSQAMWVCKMNNIRSRVEEIIWHDLIRV